jgi:hypothetical protein
MQIIEDFFMISVDQLYESSVNKDGILTLASSWVDSTTIERFGHKRVYGRVEMCPLSFSNKMVELVDPGYPAPKVHVSGEYIGRKHREGFKNVVNNYSPAGCDGYGVQTISDVARDCDIRRFDKVYFDPIVTEPDNYLGPHGKGHLYKILPTDVICVVRDGEIMMQADWCLLESVKETYDDITTKSGIMLKAAPGEKFMQGKMMHFREFPGVEQGDIVLHMPGLNWLFLCEGRTYYAIQREFIFAKLQDNGGQD